MDEAGKDAGTYGEQYGPEFQRHILAAITRSKGLAVRYRSALSHQFFVSKIDKTIAQALLAHIDVHRCLPTLATMIEETRLVSDEGSFPKVEKVLRGLFERDISDVKSVEAKIVTFGLVQAMANAVLEAAEKVDKGEKGDVMPIIKKALLVGTDILDFGIDYKNAADTRKLWYIDNEGDRIPTGITHLDAALGGGLGRRELGVVLGIAKRGKSTYLINLGYGAVLSASGLNVVHYSCEMRQNIVARRYDDRLAGPYRPLRYSDPDKYVTVLADRVNKFHKGQLYIKSYPTRTLTPSMIRAHLAFLESKDFWPDCVAEGSMVLTRRGLVPIEKVTALDKVWDGEEWVSQYGPVYRGVRKVIRYAGLTATEDHQVWTADGWRAFGDCAKALMPIAITATDTPIAVGMWYSSGQKYQRLGTQPVWDLQNCGPRNRFTVEGLLAHNCIICDYADIMRPERRLGETRHEVAGLFEDLREIAGEYDAAVWTGTQAKQGAVDKEDLAINDFGEAWEKAAIIDVGIAFNQTAVEATEQKCRLGGLAVRGVEDGFTVECNIHRRQCLIRSVALYDAARNRLDAPDEEDVLEDGYAPAVSGAPSALKDKLIGVNKQKIPSKKGKYPSRKDKRPSKRIT